MKLLIYCKSQNAHGILTTGLTVRFLSSFAWSAMGKWHAYTILHLHTKHAHSGAKLEVHRHFLAVCVLFHLYILFV